MDGKAVSLETIQKLALIPPLPTLRAQVLGTMLAPITGLAVVLKQIAEKMGEGAPAEAAAELPPLPQRVSDRSLSNNLSSYD
jgi:large subunit ribosomal protein L10